MSQQIEFLVFNSYDYIPNELFQSGKILAHEWAKYRYGVFEEYGYPGDDIYPMFYYDQNGQLVPNYCTDTPVQGYRK